MCQTVLDNDARDTFLKKADDIDHRWFSVVQRSPSDVQILQALVQRSESDSIPRKVVKECSGELGTMKKDNPSPVK